LRGDTSSFKGGKHGDDHPLAWCQEFEGGRSAYIALGHFDEAWDSEWYVDLVKRGLMWVARQM
jgi:type 1 glutamine amidotransferase